MSYIFRCLTKYIPVVFNCYVMFSQISEIKESFQQAVQNGTTYHNASMVRVKVDCKNIPYIVVV